MARDQLFLLKPDFMAGPRGPCYCPACAMLEGVLAFYPQLRKSLDIHYVDFPRPRAAVIAAVGAENQGLPLLVVAPDPLAELALAGLDVREWEGRRFLRGPGDMGRYLARRYGSGEPH
ncbi:MAG: DUF3088 domain-containing protein [Gammaproteobacteria bacterium]|nr:DUF3088 domain-containing protein [Gammaproteobacteria bacterium]